MHTSDDVAIRQIDVAVVGTGWIGEIRASTCANHPLVRDLYLADVDAKRVERVAQKTDARTWTADHRELLERHVDAVIISAAPSRRSSRAMSAARSEQR